MLEKHVETEGSPIAKGALSQGSPGTDSVDARGENKDQTITTRVFW